MNFSDTRSFLTGERVERRLAAILVADVVSYSRLMHFDEETTHARVTALLTDAVLPAVAAHSGRVVKNTGDGFLAEFPSAVDAVRSAVRFQDLVFERTIDDAEHARIQFRVGINIGDVIVGAHDIFGDDVNIAARLEALAEPGGICLSLSALDQVRGKVNAEFTDLGEQSLKNIARPVRAYALAAGDGGRPASGRATLASPAPRLSIVVLPFVNFGADPEQDYFVDGVTESLTTDLSRIHGSFVITRNTAFSYKGKSPDIRRIGRELNVRYALEGSMQRGRDRLRVNVQLIDAESGKHLWADRFDKPFADLFDIQDEIVSCLANTLDCQLSEAEAQRASRSPHPDAMDLYFQGRACWNRGMAPEHLGAARNWFAGALALDPHYAGAHLALGAVYMFTNRAIRGIRECERALVLDRNLADAHGCIGMAKYFVGRAIETEGHVQEALRLSPRDIFANRWLLFVGIAKGQLGQDEEAVAWLRRSIEVNRNFPLAHFHLAEALALLGELDEARAAAQAGLALDPGFNLHRYRVNALSDNPVYLAGREHSYQGMRLAGVPER
jgi:TolB-like protein/class 3 adenylate cyclase